jgi:hypothetical protein
MNTHVSHGLFNDIALRIQRAVEDLRAAVRDGTAADPVAAMELAERMERYAEGVLAGQMAPPDLGGLKSNAAA